MQIRSLALTKRPIWIDVKHGSLERIEFRASVKFLPEGINNAALFLIEYKELPEQHLLNECGITCSAIGAYVYLSAPDRSGKLVQTISLPKGNIKRIGIRTWNWADPIVLEDITFVAHGAEVFSRYEVASDILMNDFAEFQEQARPVMLGLNLMSSHAACNAYCHAIRRNWYETMDNIAERYTGSDVGRINCSFKVEDGSLLPVTVYNGTPAMLRIPANHSRYLEKIGDKARNMIRKAQRQGYEYKKVEPDDYLDDVLAIRISDPERQGRQIPEYYRQRPERIIDEPFRHGCGVHGEEFYGLFKDGKLCAYTTIFFYGELGQVNHILGHTDHLREGIMNLLVSEMVREIIEHKPWVRAINYLYPHNSKSNSGLGLFKRSIGFLPERVVVTEGEREIASLFSDLQEIASFPLAEPVSEKKVLRASASRAVKAVAALEYALPKKADGRMRALDLAMQALVTNHAALKTLRVKGVSAPMAESFEATSTYAIVFENIPFESFQEFLSINLKGFRKSIPKESFFLLDLNRKTKAT
jgi:hypothetical protein